MLRANIDGDAAATTMNKRSLLAAYQPFPARNQPAFFDAEGTICHPTGWGYLKVPSFEKPVFLHCYEMPCLHQSVISLTVSGIAEASSCCGFVPDVNAGCVKLRAGDSGAL
jgi:hypothetical protein